MDNRLAEHLSNWMKDQLTYPCAVELRCRQEIIDCVDLKEDSVFLTMAEDLLEAATADAFSEGKTRTYELVAISDKGDRTVCPLRIRRRIDKSASDLVALLTKQNTELHEMLRKKDKEAHELTLQFAKAVSHENARLVEENAKGYALRSETLDKLESLRSKDLERKMAIEEAEQAKEVKERIVDTAMPLFTAMAGKFLKGKVPTETSIASMIKSLNENQLENIKSILGDQYVTFDELTMGVLNGRNVNREFGEFAQSLSSEKKQGIVGILNIGQQALLQEILQANGATHR